MRRLSDALENGDRNDPEAMSKHMAYMGRVLAHVADNMVTRAECDRRHVRRFDWRTFAALMPGAIALLGFIATLILRIF